MSDNASPAHTDPSQRLKNPYYALLAEGYQPDQTLTCNALAALVYRGVTIKVEEVFMVDTCAAWCPAHERLFKGTPEIVRHFQRKPGHLQDS